MKNVFIQTLALGASMSLITACQDRGAFQSRTYSKQEVAAFLAKQGQLQQPKDNSQLPPDQANVAPPPAGLDKTIPVGGQNTNGGSVTGSTPVPSQAGATPVPGNAANQNKNNGQGQQGQPPAEDTAKKPGAQSQILIENIDVKKTVEAYQQALAAPNSALASLVAGLDVNLIRSQTPSPVTLDLFLDGKIQLGDKMYDIHFPGDLKNAQAQGKDTSVTFPADGRLLGRTPLITKDGVNVDAGDSLVITAFCADKECADAYVDLKIKASGAEIVILLQPAGDRYLMKQTNILFQDGSTIPQSFAQSQNDDANKDKKDAPATQPTQPGQASNDGQKGDKAKSPTTPAQEDGGGKSNIAKSQTDVFAQGTSAVPYICDGKTSAVPCTNTQGAQLDPKDIWGNGTNATVPYVCNGQPSNQPCTKAAATAAASADQKKDVFETGTSAIPYVDLTVSGAAQAQPAADDKGAAQATKTLDTDTQDQVVGP